MKAPLLAATTLAAALAWSAALIVDESPFGPAPAFLLAVGLLVTSTVAFIGMAVAGGRWAHRVGLGALSAMGVLAVIREIDAAWMVATALGGLSLTTLLSPGLTRSIRKLPSASGPPPRALAPPIALLFAPSALGLGGGDAPGLPLLVVGLTAPVVAWLYSRVIPGGLPAIRLGWPLLALGLSPTMGVPAGPVSAGLALLVGLTAWDRSVKTSYHPPREIGSTFPIPPELTPPEILEAADLDERGRRR